ncbi:hypothetical protein AB6A40_001892 [Gnathostoma spinigerum]|uniref:Phosphatidylinositol N-acetylglucosaminyltransferase subunit C n=1 Tax=Gnathostoma spinigerum TaxID=75299 RepID=A0ABD6E5E7_9BILA
MLEGVEGVSHSKVKWRKILYEKQPFPDNYSGGSEFLKELRKNVSVVHYSFFEAVCGASRVMLHANAIVLYAIIFEALQRFLIDSFMIFAAFTVAFLAIYIKCALTFGLSADVFLDHFFTLVVLISFGYALTPLIRTLTDTISTDTIYAMSASLFLSSFIFHDYAMEAPMVSMVLSVNLSLAASVCLVSRVASNETAFCLLSLSMALFSYWPSLRNYLTTCFPTFPLTLIFFICPLCCICLYIWSPVAAFLFLIIHLLVVLGCPWILVRMQPLKNTIHGPWDEVMPISCQYNSNGAVGLTLDDKKTN